MSTSYEITDPHDPLFDHDADTPFANRYFEWIIRLAPPERKTMYRKQRMERQQLKARQRLEAREVVA